MTAVKRRNLKKILPFGIFTTLFALLYVFLEKGILGDREFYPSTGNPYDFLSTLIATIPGGFLIGSLLALLEVFFLDKMFIHKTFVQKVFVKGFFYIILVCLLVFVAAWVMNSFQLETSLFSRMVFNSAIKFVLSFGFISIVLYALTCISVLLLISEVSDNLGQKVLVNYLTGKYHKPLQEERIFMFLDMKSSTTIAESLGHIRYFDYLNRYYEDLTEFILQSRGEIYQYVGDEVIVSWPVITGIQKNRCLECFFRIREGMRRLEDGYESRYGFKPDFKAGMHSGFVTTGEIGNIKKEIVFSGDVLNTTARVQECCNQYKVELLITERLCKQLSNEGKYSFEKIGEIQLRGKEETVILYNAQKDVG